MMRSLIAIAVLSSASFLAAAQQDDKPTIKKSNSSTAEKSFAGHWCADGFTLTFAKGDQQTFSEKGENGIYATFTEKTITLWLGKRKFGEMTYVIDPRQTPATVNATFAGKELLGIYKIGEDSLSLRLNDAALGRPKSFDDKHIGIAMDLRQVRGHVLVILNAKGSQEHFYGPFSEFTAIGSPRWSREGGKLTFDSSRSWSGEDYSWTHVFTVNADGTSIKDLGEGALPNFSPGDKLITFCQYRSNQGVWVMNADGSGKKLIDANGWCSDWTAKDEVVYTVHEHDGANLRVTNIDTDVTRLLLDGGRYRQIYWGLSTSADGRRVCFKGLCPDGDVEIAIVNTDGKEKGFKVLLSNATPGVDKFDHYVNWTPDGKFVTALVKMKNKPNWRSYLLDVEGKAAPRLLEGQETTLYQGATSYSPDGKKILAVRAWQDRISKKTLEKE
jgi:uncharacterized protein (TIGR03067 family)